MGKEKCDDSRRRHEIVLEKTLESPLDSKEPKSILKEINPEYSLEGLMLNLKFQFFSHLMRRLNRKDPDAGKDWGQEEKGMTEDEMVGWHHWLNGHEFEQTPGDGEGQGSLVCCSPWGHKELDTTEQLKNNNKVEKEQNWPLGYFPTNQCSLSFFSMAAGSHSLPCTFLFGPFPSIS